MTVQNWCRRYDILNAHNIYLRDVESMDHLMNWQLCIGVFSICISSTLPIKVHIILCNSCITCFWYRVWENWYQVYAFKHWIFNWISAIFTSMEFSHDSHLKLCHYFALSVIAFWDLGHNCSRLQPVKTAPLQSLKPVTASALSAFSTWHYLLGSCWSNFEHISRIR